jgi:muramoyltetrapeptide carboxypeptidase
MGKGIDPFTEEHFWGQIYNHRDHYEVDLSECGARAGKAGSATGVLLGGCLSMVTGLLGTPYAPDYTDAILFLEDVGEKPYKIDRYLAQLKQAGILDQISGLILGIFDDCQAEAGEVSFTLSEILEDYTAPLEIPVILDFPYGHIPKKVTMPIGSMAAIDTKKGRITFSNIFR